MRKLRVMVDINVILDVLENRNGWVRDAAGVCAVCGGSRVIGFVPTHAVTTVYYIVRKRGGKPLADKAIDWMLSLFRVARCGAEEFRLARSLDMDDFEDATVAACAKCEACDYIVTRNAVHFKNAPVSTLSPGEFLSKLPPLSGWRVDGSSFA